MSRNPSRVTFHASARDVKESTSTSTPADDNVQPPPEEAEAAVPTPDQTPIEPAAPDGEVASPKNASQSPLASLASKASLRSIQKSKTSFEFPEHKSELLVTAKTKSHVRLPDEVPPKEETKPEPAPEVKPKKEKGKAKEKPTKPKKAKAPKVHKPTKEESLKVGIAGKSNEELVKIFSETAHSAKSLTSKSLSKTRQKSRSKKLLKEHVDEEEDIEALPIEKASWELLVTPADEDEAPKTEPETTEEGTKEEPERKSTLSKSKSSHHAIKRKSQGGKSVVKIQSRIDKDAEEQPEKGEAESAEVSDKDKKEKKGKGKKGKKTKKSKELEEPSDSFEGSIKEPAVSMSKYSSFSRFTTSGDRSTTKSWIGRKTGDYISKSKMSAVFEEESSSTTSSEVEKAEKKKKTRVTMRTSKMPRKKASFRKTKDSGFEIAEDEEEVIQKITEPSVISTPVDETPIAKKPPKKKKAVGKEKKKVRKPKEPKVVKTEAQLEEEAKAKAEEERIKALEEKRSAIAREKRELLEATMRGEQLEMTLTAMEECDAALEEVSQAEQAAEEWRQYLVCDGLPAPWDVPGMNTYIHLWEKEVYTVSSERCKERTKEAINLLHQLEDILDDPFDKSERKLNDWAWVASRFREFQALNLEYCTYRLLRDIKSKMNRISIPTADFRMQEELFSLCLWVSITQPTPTENPRSVAKPRIRLIWNEMSVDVTFPTSLKREMVAIRGMYTKYDHMTDTCSTFRVQNVPEYYSKTLQDACHDELICKMKYKYDNRVVIKKDPVEQVQEDGTVVLIEPAPEPELDPQEIPPKVPYQKLEVSPSDYCLKKMEDLIGESLLSMAPNELPEIVLNLRKYTVLGGVYYLDLFYQPPQPQGMVSYEVFISTLTEPYSLQTAPFVVKYEPPPPHEPGTRRTPEEIEEELLAQEKELDELIFVQITLPKHVYWLEPPIIVQWDYRFEAWTTHNVFDFKNIEEKGYVTFRTGVFRPIAIATLRWSNLPYQAWEVRPEKDGTVTFQLSCAILTLEFHVVKDTICVKDVQSAPNEAFDPHLNVYYHFSKLRKIMQEIGIDVFPFFDTFLFVEGTCEKFWPMENHLYFIMAYLSVAFNMTWSRWNMTLDFRSIVFQMRTYRFDRPKQANFDTVLVRAQSTVYIDCTEVSQDFSDAPMEDMRFFADLWHLVRSTTTKSLRNKITSADRTMVKTLYRLYKNVRFLSFS